VIEHQISDGCPCAAPRPKGPGLKHTGTEIPISDVGESASFFIQLAARIHFHVHRDAGLLRLMQEVIDAVLADEMRRHDANGSPCGGSA